jgi:predicted O-methyltransferase YrrM
MNNEELREYLISIGFMNKKLLKQLSDTHNQQNPTPYLEPNAIETIKNNLQPTDVMLEFGCGFSTLFFSQYVKRYISIEHQYKWMLYVHSYLREYREINNIEVFVVPNMLVDKTEHQYENIRYEDMINYVGIQKYDVIFIDGLRRYLCGKSIIPYIHEGTRIYMDNWDEWSQKTREEENPIRLTNYYDVVPISDSKTVQLKLKKEYLQ